MDFIYVATDCSVTSVGHACLYTAYLYMLVLISGIVICCTVVKYLRIIYLKPLLLSYTSI